MSTFGRDLIQSLNEALAHAKGEGPSTLKYTVSRAVSRRQPTTHSPRKGRLK